MAFEEDRRRSPRIEILDRIHGHVVSLDTPVRVGEMSLGGMSIQTSFAFPENSLHEFRLRMGDDSVVLLKGRVIRCREGVDAEGAGIYISGVQFVDDDPTDTTAVEGLIDKIK